MVKFSGIFKLKSKIYLPTLIGIVLSVSMFAGLNFFFEASQKANFDEAFSNISDIEVYHSHEIWYDGGRHCYPNTKFSELFTENDQKIQSLMENSTLKIKEFSRSSSVIFDRGYLVLDEYQLYGCQNATDVLDYFFLMNSTLLGVESFESSFYQSEYFSTYFKLIEGHVPENSSEYLIDYITALKYGLTVGDMKNFTIREGNVWRNPDPTIRVAPRMLDYSFENLSICGIYLPKYYKAKFNQEFFSFSYNFEDYQNGKKYTQEFVEKPIFFCWSNFSNPTWDNPVNSLIQAMKNNSANRNWKNGRFYLNGATGSAYIYLYERDTLKYRNINTDSKQIYVQMRNISSNLPIRVEIRSYVEFTMRQFLSEIQDFRTKLFFMSIPMIFCAILVGSSLQKSLEKKRLNEIFLLRCKGMSIRSINLHIFKEISIVIIFSWILSILCGVLTFYLYYLFMGNIFIKSTFEGFLVPYISVNPLIISLIICTFEVLIIYLPLRKKIKNQHFNDLNQSLNSPFADSEEFFDNVQQTIQVSINRRNRLKQFFVKRARIKKKINSMTGENSTNSQNWKDVDLYYDPEEYHFRFKSFLFKTVLIFVIAIFPLFLISVTILSYSMTLPDNYSGYITFCKKNPFLLEILLMCSMVLNTVGLSRILFQDNPSLFTRSVKYFSHFIVKDFDTLISMELIGKKKWLNILILFSSFIGLLVFTNFIYQSNIIYSTLMQNNGRVHYFVDLEANQSVVLTSLEFYNFFFKFLISSSLFILVESAILQMLLFKENHILNQSLMMRGLTTSILYKILFFESAIIFLFGTIIGIIIGIGFGLLVSFNNFLKWQWEYFQYMDHSIGFGSIIHLEVGKVLLIILTLFFLSVSLFFIYVINRKKLTPRPNEL
ncbi:hypothetical protein NEF87_004657 [Candidatus Lokiarchaeum ossiferum]|uniref:ABC3 transporter permease protein domain-containing protein n=1 Tax=Candidatus Lokiarchaeum ossiferum TaxID=2951803 RepID=A0ABY6HZR3_9ARCH|nr:hypothetical protein NEF87_004657 [Candidatus Lokiarchaeum sp. B-35]